jgi:hypothetical protein
MGGGVNLFFRKYFGKAILTRTAAPRNGGVFGVRSPFMFRRNEIGDAPVQRATVMLIKRSSQR